MSSQPHSGQTKRFLTVVKSSRTDLDFEYSRENLKRMTSRVRSVRPLVHEMASYSITRLKELGLLNVGQTNRHIFDKEFSFTTSLAGETGVLKIQIQKTKFVIALASRPLGSGLVWYFRDPLSDRLVKSIYFSVKDGLIYGRKAAGGLYASQFQSKCYRQLLRMDLLILAIDGARRDRVGPARGESKLEKLQKLSRIFSDVRAANRERDAVLTKFPQLYYTMCAANTLLKRELGKAHKNWVPSRRSKPRGNYSTNGLDLIP